MRLKCTARPSRGVSTRSQRADEPWSQMSTVAAVNFWAGVAVVETNQATDRVDSSKPHLPRMALVLAYKAFPCAVFPPTAQKPLIPKALRACLHASHHFFNALDAQFFFARADAALLTIFPLLLLVRVAFVKPPTVFTFLPLKTATLASLPFATTLTFLTFFMAFVPFIFMAFIAAFMAGLRAAFIALAIAAKHDESPKRMRAL